MNKKEIKQEIKEIKKEAHRKINKVKVAGLIIGFLAQTLTGFYFVYNVFLSAFENNVVMNVTSFTIMIITFLSVNTFLVKDQNKKDMLSISMMLLTIFLVTFNFLVNINVLNFS